MTIISSNPAAAALQTSAAPIRTPADFTPAADEILEKTFMPLFESTVERQPDRIAIKRGSTSLSYRALNNAVNHLANEILSLDALDKSPIAILSEDEVLCIIGALAALKSGRPYVLLHPERSEDAAGFLRDSGAGVLVTAADLLGLVDRLQPAERPPRTLIIQAPMISPDASNPAVRVEPDAPFAIYYTSGSTGQPKGVLLGHFAKSHGVFTTINTLRLSPSDRTGLVLSIWHAGVITSVLSALVSGGTVYPLGLRAGSAPDAAEWLKQHGITSLWCTPSFLRSIFRHAPDKLVLSDLRFLRLGGEKISAGDVEIFKLHTAPDCVLMLSYASSEAGPISEHRIYHDSPSFDDPLPAGYPRPGVEISIQDEEGIRVEAGSVGEICVASPFLCIGYWRNPELTQRVFKPHPRDASLRVFHTGDLGVLRPDGQLEVLGRKDTQVKIRGFRVQLEAVDLALRSLDGVADAGTIVDRTADDSSRLVAYVVMEEGRKFSSSQLRAELSALLPSYAVPSLFIQMQVLPRTGLGKLARNALPPPSSSRPAIASDFVGPRNEQEVRVAGIWERILSLQGIGVEDDFFELGGDSLSAIQMTLEVEKVLGRGVPQSFFEKPTVARLVQALSAPVTGQQPDEQFRLASHRAEQSQTNVEPRKPRTQLTPAKLVSRTYSWRDLDRLVDLLVARNMARQNCLDAIQWAVRWSQDPIVRALLYGRRRGLFGHWLASLSITGAPSSNLFATSLLANILPHGRVLLPMAGQGPDNRKGARRMRQPYKRSLADILNSTPVGSLPAMVQVTGQEKLVAAHRRGKGVILVSAHGLPGPGTLLPVERLLDLAQIPTISWRTPRRQSRYAGTGDQLPPGVADTLNSEVALYSARLLQAGKIINILNDSPDRQGHTYAATIAGRQYQFKAGFAEFALDTGAAIVPYRRTCLQDGVIRFEFEAPLDPGDASRSQSVEALVGQYASFLQTTWSTHPESVRWRKMQKHLNRPLSTDAD